MILNKKNIYIGMVQVTVSIHGGIAIGTLVSNTEGMATVISSIHTGGGIGRGTLES